MSKRLLVADPTKYGSCYCDHLFDQYKLFVDSVEKVSDRRQNANNYFITINTALISFIGFAFQNSSFSNAGNFKLLLSIVGVVICVIFWFLIRSYKQLNTGKLKVIHEIEKHLPAALYRYEWDLLEKGENKNVYFPFSHVEMYIPWVFGAIYAFLVITFW